jgi:hypothetical protein
VQIEQLIPPIGITPAAALQQFGFGTHVLNILGETASFENKLCASPSSLGAQK